MKAIVLLSILTASLVAFAFCVAIICMQIVQQADELSEFIYTCRAAEIKRTDCVKQWISQNHSDLKR